MLRWLTTKRKRLPVAGKRKPTSNAPRILNTLAASGRQMELELELSNFGLNVAAL